MNLSGPPPHPAWLARLRAWPASALRRLPVYTRIVLGLLLLIAAGTGLLLLPGIAVAPLAPADALFTAVSALTVTGLGVLPTSTAFTRAGHALLLCLIQIGGVGYMFMAALVLRLIGRRVSLLDRIALSSSLGLDRPTAVSALLRRTLAGILLIEGAGALLLAAHWRASGIVPDADVWFYALFHAVSAFCHAGFDLFAGDPRYPNGIPGDDLSLLILGALIFAGSIGIPVLMELFARRRRLSLNARVTLGVAVALVLVGWGGLFLPETRPGGVLDGAPLDQQLVHTLFQSISARTAGFPGLKEFTRLAPPTQLLLVILMFIGCAPASMGGGITTGTFAVLGTAMWSYARGRPTPQIGGWTIRADTVRRAGAVLTVGLGLVILSTWLLLLTHPFSLNTALFEVVSAYATCGLSLGITPELNLFGRFVIMLMMCWGRLGALTIVTAVAGRTPSAPLVQYPETSILIG